MASELTPRWLFGLRARIWWSPRFDGDFVFFVFLVLRKGPLRSGSSMSRVSSGADWIAMPKRSAIPPGRSSAAALIPEMVV